MHPCCCWSVTGPGERSCRVDEMSESEHTGGASFPSFHERSGEYSAGDRARIALTEVLRELVVASMRSTAAAADVDAARALVVKALEHLSESGPTGGAATDSHFMDRSPLMGLMNAIAPPMRAEVDSSVGEFGAVVCRVVFTEPFEGPPGHVHGGFVAAAFDEVLGQAQSLTGRPGMTGRLSTTYRAPTPLHVEIVFRGWVESVEGRKIFTRATAHAGETLCGECEGLFLSMPPELLGRLRKGRDIAAREGQG